MSDHVHMCREAGASANDDPCPTTPSPVDSSDILNLCIRKDRKWDNGSTISVGFCNGSAALQDKTIHYATRWLEDTSLHLIRVKRELAQIRVGFNTSGDSWSMLGTSCLEEKNYWKPTMSLVLNEETRDDLFERTVLHEFGHALGCMHEHQSPEAKIQWNKDAVCRDYGDGTSSSHERLDRNFFSKLVRDKTMCSEFDENSIMMYAIESEHTEDGYHVDEKYTLSATDKRAIRQFYPKEPNQDIFYSALALSKGNPPPLRLYLAACWKEVCSYMHWCWLRIHDNGARPKLSIASL